jgi:predicted nucleic acid-binding protein
MIIEDEVLPFFDIVEVKQKVKNVCRDPEDDKFIFLALSAAPDFVVTGDKDLGVLKDSMPVKIIGALELVDTFKKHF